MEQEYIIQKIQGAPEWGKVPRFGIDHVLWTPDAGVRAGGQVCRDGEALYVHLYAIEKEIRAEYTAPLSPVCRDSCLEFFLMPEGAAGYFNFEINPNGCLCLQYGPERNDRYYLVREDADRVFGIRTGRTPDGWEVFYRIPLAFLRIFVPGCAFAGILRANAYKCGDDTVHPHFLAWHPVRSEKPDFHLPGEFGTMRFGE